MADAASLDAACAALAAFDWSADSGFAKTLDAAVIAAHGHEAARADLEHRFAAVLAAGTSRAAKEYACRKLAMIGTAASVPALAALLPQPDHSHMARFTLERIAAPEAGKALRDALAALRADLAIGMMASLAARGDAASVPALAARLQADGPEAVAAAVALGRIATPEAAAALATADAFAGGPRATRLRPPPPTSRSSPARRASRRPDGSPWRRHAASLPAPTPRPPDGFPPARFSRPAHGGPDAHRDHAVRPPPRLPDAGPRLAAGRRVGRRGNGGPHDGRPARP
jgi:hypothetical protein